LLLSACEIHGAVARHQHARSAHRTVAELLTAVAGRTSRIRLLTGVTVLSIHDLVLVAEEYALLGHLSEGRLDLVISKAATATRSAR
jgi:alkanesulfonate monooxygenase SsuD/methylene tetrahydromethanopterin reductase-like flavin-dependent oxidoreductase (luciferase family)